MPKITANPGVYTVEKNAFPNSVVGVPTSIPAFIGYTEKALNGNISLLNKPTRISSLGEYVQFFGGAPTTLFELASDGTLVKEQETQFYLYWSVQLFFANGGGDCYIVSVGSYANKVNVADFNNSATQSGLIALEKEPEPALLVIPDAMLFDADDCYALQQSMLAHCGALGSRFAILDIYKGYEAPGAADDVIQSFRNNIGSNYLPFGAAYYPWLNCSVIGSTDISYRNIGNLSDLANLLLKELNDNEAAGKITANQAKAITAEIGQMAAGKADPGMVRKTVLPFSPILTNLYQTIQSQLNLLPPSGAIAGIYAMTDNAQGVFKAPANVALTAVTSLTVAITDQMQGDLNVPIDGKAVNAIRTFPGKGPLVWGARTLAGNDQDWRYVQVKRSAIYIEQSIKQECAAYHFAANDASTWANVRATIENFLTDFWRAGGLYGAKPQDAFAVQVGLGTTMTQQDITDGIMRVNVMIAMVRPAEFIVITLEQEMARS